MVQILAIKFFIAAWKHTLAISSKLKPRTWIFLTVLHACIAVISLWAYQAKSVSESAIPPVYRAELVPVPVRSPSGDNVNCISFVPQRSVGSSWRGSRWAWTLGVRALHSPSRVRARETTNYVDVYAHRQLGGMNIPGIGLNVFSNGLAKYEVVEYESDGMLASYLNRQPDVRRDILAAVEVREVAHTRRITRFGWTPQHASTLSFASDAYLSEIGLTPGFDRSGVSWPDPSPGELANLSSLQIPESGVVTLYSFTPFNLFSTGPESWHLHYQVTIEEHQREGDQFGFRIPRFFDVGRYLVVQTSSPDTPYLLGPMERIVALLVGIVTSLLSILNAFFAWQIYRRAKMEAVLRDLQIRELRMRLDEMERQRLREINDAATSSIILLN